MFEATNPDSETTFNRDKSNQIQDLVSTKNLDKNENENPDTVPDQTGSDESASAENPRPDQKPDKTGGAETSKPRESQIWEKKSTIQFEEDIIDGFLFQSFEFFEDLNVVVAQELKSNEKNERVVSKPVPKEPGPEMATAPKLLMPNILVGQDGPRGVTQQRDRPFKNQHQPDFASNDEPSNPSKILVTPMPKKRGRGRPVKNKPQEEFASHSVVAETSSVSKKSVRPFKKNQKCETLGPDCANPNLKKAHPLLATEKSCQSGANQRRRLSVHNTNSAESGVTNKPKSTDPSQPNLAVKPKSTLPSEPNLPIKVPKKRGRPPKVPPPNSTTQSTNAAVVTSSGNVTRFIEAIGDEPPTKKLEPGIIRQPTSSGENSCLDSPLQHAMKQTSSKTFEGGNLSQPAESPATSSGPGFMNKKPTPVKKRKRASSQVGDQSSSANGKTSHTCLFCDRRSETALGMAGHYMRGHAELMEHAGRSNNDDPSRLSPIKQCGKCSYESRSYESLMLHFDQEHGMEQE